MRSVRFGFLFVIVVAALSAQSPAHQQQTRQEISRDDRAQRNALQAQGKQILRAELAREAVGNCKTAQNTAEFNECFGKELDRTTHDLECFRAVIHGLLSEDEKEGDP